MPWSASWQARTRAAAAGADDEPGAADREWFPGGVAWDDAPSIVVSVVMEALVVMLSLSSLTMDVRSLARCGAEGVRQSVSRRG